MPEDRINERGEIERAKGLRGESKLGKEREYIKLRDTRPRRNARRRAALGGDILERRAAPVSGTLLERIVFKRLEAVWGPVNIAFVYKYQLGTGGAKDARVFLGGIEMDFIVLNRPSGKEMALEIQGAHWHGPADQFTDMDRALTILAGGRDYAEIWEYEILLGDEYLDNRLAELIGVGAQRLSNSDYLDQEIRRFERDLRGVFRVT